MRLFSKILLSLLCVTAVASVAGVSASWHYTNGEYKTAEQNSSIALTAYHWDGADELPEDSNIGENHLALVERIVYSSEGLNTASSHLNDVIQSRINNSKDTASSVAPTQGGNLKPLFNTSEIAKLDFLLWFIFDEQKQVVSYEVYTFETDILGKKESVRVKPVYRTIIEPAQDGKWKATHSEKGSAETIKYDVQQGGGKYLTINPRTFVKE